MTRQIDRPVHILTTADSPRHLQRLAEALRERREAVTLHGVPGSHPSTTDEARLEADAIIARIPDGAVVLVEGAVLPAAAHALYIDRFRLRVAALVARPLHTAPGLEPGRAALLRRIEGTVLANLRRILVAEPGTAAEAADLGADPRRIALIPSWGGISHPAAEERGNDLADRDRLDSLADAVRSELARIVPQDQRIERIA